MNLNNSYMLPKVAVSGKYEIIVSTESGDAMDSMWLFKDDRGMRTSLKIKEVGRLLEPYLPLKAADMDKSGVIGIYEAMVADARKDIAEYRKGLDCHLGRIQDATIAWYKTLYDERWSDDWDSLQTAIRKREEYIVRSFQTYRKAVAFLRMVYCEMSGENISESDL